MSIKSDDDFIIIEKDYDCRFFTDSYTEEINKVIKEINNVSKEEVEVSKEKVESNVEVSNEVDSNEVIEFKVQNSSRLKTQLDSRIDPVIFVPGPPFEIIPNYEEDELEKIFRKTIEYFFNFNIIVEEFTNDHFTA